jgi:hypothetical protein
MAMRIVGMNIHRSFTQMAILEKGQITKELRVDLTCGPLMKCAKTLRADDEVGIEATGNSAAVERLMRQFVKRIAVANPRLVRAIAYARVRTDKIDTAILARLHASKFLPEVRSPTKITRDVGARLLSGWAFLNGVVRLKGRIQAVLHSNLIPKYTGICSVKLDASSPTACRCPPKSRPYSEDFHRFGQFQRSPLR